MNSHQTGKAANNQGEKHGEALPKVTLGIMLAIKTNLNHSAIADHVLNHETVLEKHKPDFESELKGIDVEL